MKFTYGKSTHTRMQPPNIQNFKQKVLSGSGFKVYKNSSKKFINIFISNLKVLKIFNY